VEATGRRARGKVFAVAAAWHDFAAMSRDDHTYHSFNSLVLTLTESGLDGIATDHSFELRSTGTGAEVWRSSVLHAEGGSCESDPRLIGFLGTRQVIELLVEIERSGIYEALPALGIVDGSVDPTLAPPLVSMRVESAEQVREVVDHVPGDAGVVAGVVRAVRDAVAVAQERALTVAG
jgi:hypothetical protein